MTQSTPDSGPYAEPQSCTGRTSDKALYN